MESDTIGNLPMPSVTSSKVSTVPVIKVLVYTFFYTFYDWILDSSFDLF